jgi:hypothetical protein
MLEFPWVLLLLLLLLLLLVLLLLALLPACSPGFSSTRCVVRHIAWPLPERGFIVKVKPCAPGLTRLSSCWSELQQTVR